MLVGSIVSKPLNNFLKMTSKGLPRYFILLIGFVMSDGDPELTSGANDDIAILGSLEFISNRTALLYLPISR